MAVEFYDVKTKAKVNLDEKNIQKTTFTSDTGQVRYGLRGKTADGRALTKFVSKDTWDAMKVEVLAEVKKAAAEKKAPAKKEAAAKPEKKAAKKDDKKPAAKKK
jgi:hypothetical protein